MSFQILPTRRCFLRGRGAEGERLPHSLPAAHGLWRSEPRVARRRRGERHAAKDGQAAFAAATDGTDGTSGSWGSTVIIRSHPIRVLMRSASSIVAWWQAAE
jgi:hypothetical protein